MAPVEIQACSLSGPLWTVTVDGELMMHEVVSILASRSSIPLWELTVLLGTADITMEASSLQDILLRQLSPEARARVTLVRQEMPEPTPSALHDAIVKGEEIAALRLLQRPDPPGLNVVYGLEGSALHRALDSKLPRVALALVSRPDFTAVNAETLLGRTALHMAAAQGSLPVCQAMLNRGDFMALLAVSDTARGDRTALELAAEMGHKEVAKLLETTERILREELQALEAA